MEKILYQLNEYMKYNKMENHPMHNTLKDAFIKGDFTTLYIDPKLYPVLNQQILQLMNEYCKRFKKDFCKIKPMFW